MIDLRLLIKSGVHFGHQTSRWSPKMEPYIWGYKNNVHLIDVSKTAFQLEKASKFLESIAAEGKSILWVGTKKAAQGIIEKLSKEMNAPYVIHRWVGGTFSNFRQVRKSVANLLHYEDVIAKSEQFNYSKKELNLFQKRIERLEKNVGGIRNLTWPIGAVVVVDVKKEHVCIKEALTTGIPVVALVDTNCDPSMIDYVIPANDDAPRSIEVVMTYLAEGAKRGIAQAEAKAIQKQVEVHTGAESSVDILGISSDDETESPTRAKKGSPSKSPAKKSGNMRPRRTEK